jgi:hypothetical protein
MTRTGSGPLWRGVERFRVEEAYRPYREGWRLR